MKYLGFFSLMLPIQSNKSFALSEFGGEQHSLGCVCSASCAVPALGLASGLSTAHIPAGLSQPCDRA